MLILHKPIIGTLLFTRLQLVPSELMNIIFIAFHKNLIGGHLNAYWTFHCLRLHFYWPGMYSDIKRMCQACPECALANPTCSKSSELVNNVPIEAPFLNLGKSQFFPHHFEFVGIAVCPEGNRPTKSKHQLLKTWPAPELDHDVANLLGFV